MSSATVKVVGLDKLLKKLDVTLVEKDLEDVLKDGTKETKDSLNPTLPRRTGMSASKIDMEVKKTSGAVKIPRYPFIFLEGGSQYNDSGGTRVHRRKTSKQWKAGRYRILPRRFLARERRKVPPRLKVLVAEKGKRIERRWAA